MSNKLCCLLKQLNTSSSAIDSTFLPCFRYLQRLRAARWTDPNKHNATESSPAAIKSESLTLRTTNASLSLRPGESSTREPQATGLKVVKNQSTDPKPLISGPSERRPQQTEATSDRPQAALVKKPAPAPRRTEEKLPVESVQGKQDAPVPLPSKKQVRASINDILALRKHPDAVAAVRGLESLADEGLIDEDDFRDQVRALVAGVKQAQAQAESEVQSKTHRKRSLPAAVSLSGKQNAKFSSRKKRNRGTR
eukprot:INCI12096.2.p1 GENE.INCI12096.2~~INCI12096.2.p1  ORF type:complete len:252 (+),score=32.33 INCI12096.2:464-1219(+)